MIRRTGFMFFIASTCLIAVASATEPIEPTAPAKPTKDSLDRFGPLAQATQAPNVAANVVPEVQSNLERARNDANVVIDETLLEFVEKHQPELLKLLKFMKKKQPQQYEQALKELSRVKQRLTLLEKRDAELYAIELELWQVRSELRMLVAEILASSKDAQAKLRKELHVLAEKELDLGTARLKLDQERVELRLASVRSQLDERTNDRDATLAKAIKTWENRAFKSSARSKKP